MTQTDNWFSDFLYFPPQIKRMFALADKDKDGKLSVAEWEQMLVQAGAPADKSVRFYSPDKKKTSSFVFMVLTRQNSDSAVL